MMAVTSIRFIVRVAGVAIALALCSPATPVRAQNVVVMVNGDPITNYDVDQRMKLTELSTHKKPSRDEVLKDLIDDKVKIKEAKRFGIDPSGADIDASYANMASRLRMSPDQLSKMLESRGVRPATLKARLKSELVWGSLVRGRFKDSLLVGESDIRSALASAGEATQDSQSFEYQMRPIVLVVPRGAAPATLETRKREADALRNQIQSCGEAINTVKSMRGAAIRDMVVKTSADLPPSLRDLLDKTPVGHLTPPELTKQGIEMVALCGRKPTTVDSPRKREIREKLYAEKYQAKSKAYLDEVRKSAMIEYR